MSLQLQPGQALSVVDLAKALKVSTTPIKEVMGRLQLEHLVEVIPQVGTYVSKIKPQLIEEAASIRLISKLNWPVNPFLGKIWIG